MTCVGGIVLFERNVYDVYGLYCESRFSIGEYEGFESGGKSYLLLPKEESMLNEQEMLAFTTYMRSVGDVSVLEPMMTLHQQRSGLIDGQECYLCVLPDKTELHQIRSVLRNEEERGSHLATIHYYGKQMPYTSRTYDFFGQWPKLWEQRLEQLEGWYQQLLYEGPRSYVDEAFLFSYPYYMGLTENAIQYVVDAGLDDLTRESEKPTICHRRFTDQAWLVISEGGESVKRPTEFVYDHACRDITEWIRDQHIKGDEFSWETVSSFINGYESYEKLSTYSWRLLYARLLFPLHYFEAVEDYYRSQIVEEKEEHANYFFHLLESEQSNEQFLREFRERFLMQKGTGLSRIPSVEWL